MESETMMLQSAEIRWFFPGSLPNDVLHWFKAGRTCEPEEPRIDEYLCFPNCDSVGTKLREGKLEIKAMTSPPRPLHINGAINGRTDQWVKWSFEDKNLKALVGPLHKAGRWIAVNKTRYLRKFSADSAALRETSSKDRPTLGCNFELTSIAVGPRQSPWYSIGFEAFGPAATIHQTLSTTLDEIFGPTNTSVTRGLTGLSSMSYPAWLATLPEEAFGIT